MPEGYPRTPEESVDVLARAKAAGEKERTEIELPKKTSEAGPAEEKPAEAGAQEKKIEAEVEKAAEKEKIEEVKKEIKKMPVKEYDAAQRFDRAEEKKLRQEIKQGTLVPAYAKGLGAGVLIGIGGAAWAAYKVVKALFWDDWLKKYFGKFTDIFQAGKKK